jgi:hypothetical protein
MKLFRIVCAARDLIRFACSVGALRAPTASVALACSDRDYRMLVGIGLVHDSDLPLSIVEAERRGDESRGRL